MNLKSIAFFFSLILILPILSFGNAHAKNDDPVTGQFLEWGDGSITKQVNSRPLSDIYIDFGRDQTFNNCNSRIDTYSHPRGSDDNFIYTSTDIYIIPSTLEIKRSDPLTLGKKLEDVAGTPNTIIHLSSLFDGTIIGNTKTIGPGLYDIVFDLCQDGVLDGEDGLMKNALEVRWIKDFKASNLDVWKSNKVERLKASAENAAATLTAVKVIWKAFTIYSAIKQILKPAQVIEDLKKASIVKKIIFGLTDATDTLDWVRFIVGAEDEVDSVNFLNKLIGIFMGMAADPPNVNYQNEVKLSPIIPITNLHSDPVNNAFVELGSEIQKENILSSSLISTFENYQGSVLNDDGKWALIHLKQAEEYIKLLERQTSETNQRILEVKEQATSSKDFNDTLILTNEIYKFANSGFDANFTRDLKNFNLTENEILKIKDFIKKEFNIDFYGSLKNLDAFLNARTAFMTSLIDLSLSIGNVINTLENESEINLIDIPMANPQSGYNGTVGSPIIFDGRNSSSKLSEVIKFEWDLNGDGNFSDAIGSHIPYEYDHFFNGFIGLKVTNDFGYSDIGYSPVNITFDNDFNNISFQPESSVDLEVNNSATFDVINNNQPTKNIEWLFDQKPISSGNSITYKPGNDDVGTHVITSKISFTNDSRTIIHNWIVGVQFPDNDVDFWNSNIDCNDNNPSINPGLKEIRYNGIDDDCNPQTLDINTPPVAKNQTIGLFQNSIRTISFSGDTAATDVDNDLLTFEIVKGSENGTLGPIKVNPFNNRIITADYTPKPNFHGKDSFTFIAKDQFAQSNVAKVNLNVGILQIPTAVDRTITVTEDTPTQIELRGISPDGHPLKFILEGTRSEGTKGQPVMGTIKNITQTSPTTANITYIPPTDFNNDISTRSR